MKKSIWNTRFPTLLGLSLIIAGIAVTTYLVRTGVIVVGKATPQEAPQNVRITNISDSSFTVSFKTSEPTVSSLSYGTASSLGNVGIDDRNQNQTDLNPFSLHHITVKNLQPNTKYLFTITSGNTNYLNNEKPFEITTGPPLSESQNNPTLAGSVTQENGEELNTGLLFVKTDTSQTVSTVIQNGKYSFPLVFREQNLLTYSTITDETTLNLLVIGESAQSEAKILASESDSVPLITLSKSYDFTTSASPSADLMNESASDSSSLIFPAFSAAETKGQPQIISPKKNERFIDQRPVFRGIAQAGSNVKITIESDPITTQIKADSRGNWSFRPATPLSAGTHTITIETLDKFGVLRRITQSFTVFAQGSQVSESATPSATPSTASPTPTRTPTSTPIPTATPIPTSVQTTPTNTPTLVPSTQPTIPQTSPPPNTPNPPGSVAQIATGIAAVVTTGLGFLLFFLGGSL